MKSKVLNDLTIFNAALEIRAPSERAAYIYQACGNDTALRQKIVALLAAYENGNDTFEQIERANTAQNHRESNELERPGTLIGRYKLLQKIGEGGCGVVYMAEQEEPVRRRVALKIIKLGMDTKSVIARFEAERQALALMDHTNIAKVLDAGSTQNGRPYFVMELVRGVKITDYCDEKELSTAQRLELFNQVCHAIQHAHQKGIIHRDIKPSNVLVTVNDGVAVPKVIDFGIAKATTDQRLTDKTVFTAFEQFIGTPAYMSPEQAEITSVDIDTRSDIYSLGVLLYELLTGKTPFDAAELLKIGLDEMRRTIREKEPARPSTRINTLCADELTTAAKRRGLDAPKLINCLRGDLDWIVMKCLEKDRARRYETANGLAMDIQRHLSNEPVVACPPSNIYRLQKMVRRNKVAFAVAGSIAAALIIGLGLALWQSIQKTQAYRRALEAENAARTEAAKSQQVSQFLKKMLEGAGPEVAQGRDAALLLEILDKTDAEVTKTLTNEPAVEAELSYTIGWTYLDLGKYRKGETTLRRALAIERSLSPKGSANLARALNGVGRALQELGMFSEAETLFRESVAMSRSVLGNEHRDVALGLAALAQVLFLEDKLAEAKLVGEESLNLCRKLLGNESCEVAQGLMKLGLVNLAQGHAIEAERDLREALAIMKKLCGPQHPQVGVCLNSLASALDHQGKWAECEDVARESLELQQKVRGANHPDVATGMGNLAQYLMRAGKVDQAEKLARESVEVRRRSLGNEDPGSAFCLISLANILDQEGKTAEAERFYREALNLREKLPDHTVAWALNNLAGVLAKEDKLAEAESTAREGLAIGKRAPSTEIHLGDVMCNLADILTRQNKLDEAEKVLSEPLDMKNQVHGALLFQRRGLLFSRGAQWREAAADLQRALELEPTEYMVWYGLAAVLVQLGNSTEYESLCIKALQRFQMTSNSVTATWIARACLIMPCQGTHLEAVGKLVDLALTDTNHSMWHPVPDKALAEYRAGRFASALEWAQRARLDPRFDRQPDFQVQTYATLAMSYQQLKQRTAAQTTLSEAVTAETKLPKLENHDLGGGAFSWIIAHTLLGEATELIDGRAPDGVVQSPQSKVQGPVEITPASQHANADQEGGPR